MSTVILSLALFVTFIKAIMCCRSGRSVHEINCGVFSPQKLSRLNYKKWIQLEYFQLFVLNRASSERSLREGIGMWCVIAVMIAHPRCCRCCLRTLSWVLWRWWTGITGDRSETGSWSSRLWMMSSTQTPKWWVARTYKYNTLIWIEKLHAFATCWVFF